MASSHCSDGFHHVPTRLILSVIDHCIQISGHDEAESMIFALQRRTSDLKPDLLLRLARIVVRRHEPDFIFFLIS